MVQRAQKGLLSFFMGIKTQSGIKYPSSDEYEGAGSYNYVIFDKSVIKSAHLSTK